MHLIQIYLDRLIGTEVEQKEVLGEIQDCLVIPIKPNGIYRCRGGGFNWFFGATKRKINFRGVTHFLSVHFMDMDDYSKVKELGYMDEQLKYIGQIKYVNLKPKKKQGFI